MVAPYVQTNKGIKMRLYYGDSIRSEGMPNEHSKVISKAKKGTDVKIKKKRWILISFVVLNVMLWIYSVSHFSSSLFSDLWNTKLIGHDL